MLSRASMRRQEGRLPVRRLILVIPSVTAAAAMASDPPSFGGLGDAGGGDITSNAGAVSADGLVVTGRCTPPGFQRVFRWTSAGGMVDLGGPNLATGVGASADGSVLVCSAATLAGDSLAFRWTDAGGFVALSALPNGTSGPRVFAVSGDGEIAVGDSNTPLSSTAVRWISSTVATPLSNEPGFSSSTARGISADGSVVVGSASLPGVGGVAFRWTAAGGSVALPDLAGGSVVASAAATSADGSRIAGYGTSEQGQEAALWIAGSPVGLGDLPGGAHLSSALAMSAGGGIVVGYGTTDAGEEAFIWNDEGGLRSIKQELEALGVTGVAGWTLRRATGVSASGEVIVGYGINPAGRTEAWRATIPVMCYANCDASTGAPVLTANDFLCFLIRFVAGESYANCDGSTSIPVLNVNDFQCFMMRFAQGCP